MTDQKRELPARGTYRHGDLYRVLLDAGIVLARKGGPDAIILREATRQAGVVPNAAYRHFANRNALLQAVRAASLSALARAMETELAKVDGEIHSIAYAQGCLRAVGTGYLQFAHDEPGLFRTAFATPANTNEVADPAKAGKSGMNPFELLGAALDRLAAAGALPTGGREGAEYLAWSAVHGLAVLVSEGPLRNLSPAQRESIGQSLLNMVEKGLCRPGTATTTSYHAAGRVVPLPSSLP